MTKLDARCKNKINVMKCFIWETYAGSSCFQLFEVLKTHRGLTHSRRNACLKNLKIQEKVENISPT